MATGPVTTAQTQNSPHVQPAAQTVQQQQESVLRSGERIGTSAEAIADKNSKTYYHQVAGARFIMPDGLEVHFYGGQVTTNDPTVIAELDKVANKASSLIVSEKAQLQASKQLDAKAAEEAAKAAAQN